MRGFFLYTSSRQKKVVLLFDMNTQIGTVKISQKQTSQKNITKLVTALNQKSLQEKPFSLGVYEVNLQYLEENIQKIKKNAEQEGKPLQYLLPVKGNGYGTGMKEISSFIEESKCCDYLGVAHLQEAFELRENGTTMPILILGQTSFEESYLEYISKNKIEIALSDFQFLKKIETYFSEKKGSISVHLKIDLGMGRCGVLEKDALELFTSALNTHCVHIKGIMIHFPVSDSTKKEDILYTKEQIKKFIRFKKKIENICLQEEKKDLFNALLFHTSNSGGAIEYKESVFDMIRPGIASYGYPEKGSIADTLDLKPVVKISSQFTLIKKIPKDFSVGYGRTYISKKPQYIGILPIGYADGLNRKLGNTFSVLSESGQIFPSVGRISMDQSAYLLPDNLSENDISALQKEKIYIMGDTYNAKEIASILETISYEVIILFGSSDRMRKTYSY